MNVHKVARRRAVRWRQRFHDTREVFSQDDYRLALRAELRGLGISHEFADAIAEQIDNEMCGVTTAEDIARLEHQMELLRPHWPAGGTLGEAVAAYRAAHSFAHEHEWVVFRTPPQQHALMLECVQCRAFGVVEGPPPAGRRPRSGRPPTTRLPRRTAGTRTAVCGWSASPARRRRVTWRRRPRVPTSRAGAGLSCKAGRSKSPT
jgi:hypothetical protein